MLPLELYSGLFRRLRDLSSPVQSCRAPATLFESWEHAPSPPHCGAGVSLIMIVDRALGAPDESPDKPGERFVPLAGSCAHARYGMDHGDRELGGR